MDQPSSYNMDWKHHVTQQLPQRRHNESDETTTNTNNNNDDVDATTSNITTNIVNGNKDPNGQRGIDSDIPYSTRQDANMDEDTFGSNKRYKRMMCRDDITNIDASVTVTLTTNTNAITAPSSSSSTTVPSTSIISTTTTVNHDDDSPTTTNSSFIIFSPTFCHSIVTQHRLAPVYIGIPSIRPDTTTVLTTPTGGTCPVTATVSTTTTIHHPSNMTINKPNTTGDTNHSSSPLQQPSHAQLPKQQLQSMIVYKIIQPDGTERRMTAQEKKLAKLQHKLQQKQQQQQQQQQPQPQPSQPSLHDDETLDVKSSRHPGSESSPKCTQDNSSAINDKMIDHSGPSQSDDRYVPIPSMDDASLLESDEYRTDRDGIPPIMLPPPLAQFIRPIIMPQQQQEKLLSSDTYGRDRITTTTIPMEMDLRLSECWANLLLQHSILPAEYKRQEETNIRPLPYHIVPEVWTRLRPKFYTDTSHNNIISNNDYYNSTEDQSQQDWMMCQMNATIMENGHHNNYDSTHEDAVLQNRNAILQFLHHPNHEPPLHISDGTKFGCDFLLYDGPRHERHAFAGLRILPPPAKHLPQQHRCTKNTVVTIDQEDDVWVPMHPNPYDLAGYVRCLNTAGKLALLATSVVMNGTEIKNGSNDGDQPGASQCRKILIVDLALEKIAMTTSRRPKKTMEQRLKNLSKTTKESK